MKSILLISSLVFLFGSCAHHHDKTAHHHHECNKQCKLHKNGHAYEKHCAQSVLEGKAHIMGKEEFKVVHDGQTYYFSSKKKMDAFNKDIKKNVELANKQWILRASSRI